MPYRPSRPGVWLRRDLADILSALSPTDNVHTHWDGAYRQGYQQALDDVARALGLYWREPAIRRNWPQRVDEIESVASLATGLPTPYGSNGND